MFFAMSPFFPRVVNEFDVAGQTLEYTGVEVCKVEKDNGFECKKENYDCSVNPDVVNGPSIWTEGAGYLALRLGTRWCAQLLFVLFSFEGLS